MQISLKVEPREELELTLDVDDEGRIRSAQLRGVGDLAFLECLSRYRANLIGLVSSLPIPTGNSPCEILLREAVLRAQGQWSSPTDWDEELCHCRSVTFRTVDAAIVAGAGTPEKVSQWTSASTACGTCRSEVLSMLKIRRTA